jgi:hypothetical protein
MSDRDHADETPVPAAGDQIRKVAEQGRLSVPVELEDQWDGQRHEPLRPDDSLSPPNEAGLGAGAPPERPIGLMTRRLVGRVAR